MAIWKKLEAVHLVKKAGSRFNAMTDLFRIRKSEDETLQSLVNRVSESMLRIKNLRPSGYDLDKLDDELTCMAMIGALPEDYDNFVNSLLLVDQDKIEKSVIIQAFHTYSA